MEAKGRVLEGFVTSCKMTKTIVVKVERIKKHGLYVKSSRGFKTFKAHDADQEAKEGDLVKIVESRRYSKDKYFRLLEIVRKQKA
ncbi:30S ribosomal protein S17 [Candidatus Omnitrophota bacterium]